MTLMSEVGSYFQYEHTARSSYPDHPNNLHHQGYHYHHHLHQQQYHNHHQCHQENQRIKARYTRLMIQQQYQEVC